MSRTNRALERSSTADAQELEPDCFATCSRLAPQMMPSRPASLLVAGAGQLLRYARQRGKSRAVDLLRKSPPKPDRNERRLSPSRRDSLKDFSANAASMARPFKVERNRPRQSKSGGLFSQRSPVACYHPQTEISFARKGAHGRPVATAVARAARETGSGLN